MPEPKVNGMIIATLVGQSRRDVSPRGALEIKPIKSSPPYSTLPRYKIMKERSITLDGHKVRLMVKAWPPENFLVEAQAEADDMFSDTTLQTKDRLLDEAEKILQTLSVEKDFREEFSLYCIKGYQGQPQQIFAHFRSRIASLLKSESAPLSDAEIEKTMSSSIQYGKDDLTIVDWDGAFIFDPDGDWQDTVDFLELANIHLIRLRFLDAQIDRRLGKMAAILHTLPKIPLKELKSTVQELISLRARSIIEFEQSERDIRLIGDWYAAQLYDLISRKLYLDSWRKTIREKLSSLEEITSMATEHFSVSAETRAERVQIVLWFVLIMGWFTLLFLELRYFLTRQ